MLHNKSRGNRSTDPGEIYFEEFLTIYGRGGHLGHVTQIPGKQLLFSLPNEASRKFGFDWQSGFGGNV